MIVLNNSYYLLLALLSIIGGIKVLLHLKKNNNYRLTVEKAAYVISYSFFITYISFSLAMYGLSYHKSLIKKEAKLVAYDKFRTNTIVYDIGDKRFTSSHNIYQYKGYNNRKGFIKKHKVVLQVKEPIDGLYLIYDIKLEPIL